MIPIYIKTETSSEPDASMYYLVATNGVFLVKKTDLYSSVTLADWIAGLPYQAPSLTLDVPKIPRELMEQIYGFFDAVFQKWKSEAIVVLFYQPERREFRLGIPEQTVSRYWYGGTWNTVGHVEYTSVPRPEGFLKIGDIHSHGREGAFFSLVDDEDDREDGLRMVMGSLHIEPPELCASFIAGGYRFTLGRDEVAEDFTEAMPPPPEWLERVHLRDAPAYVSWTSPTEAP